MIGLGSYGKTLTVLYGIELPDEDDQDDDSYKSPGRHGFTAD